MSAPPATATPIARETARTLLAALVLLLRALLGGMAGAGRRNHRALEGSLSACDALLEACGLADTPETAEEWVAVPTPWRAARWAVPPCVRVHHAPCPVRPAPRAMPARAPPARLLPRSVRSPGSPRAIGGRRRAPDCHSMPRRVAVTGNSPD